MKEIRTAAEIDAPAEEVWAILLDTGSWDEWNPFASGLDGDLRVGEKVTVHLRAGPGGRGMRIKPEVTALEPGRELRWVGGLLHPSVMRGEHWFRVDPLDGGRCRFENGERFSGALVAVLGGLFLRGRPGYQAMCDALKARAESTPA